MEIANTKLNTYKVNDSQKRNAIAGTQSSHVNTSCYGYYVNIISV